MSAELHVQLLLVRTGSSLAGLPLSAVAETLRPPPCRAVPDMPDFVIGVASIRGAPTPVVDLASLLGQPPEVRPTRLVTVRVGARVVALAVAAVVGVARIDDASLRGLPPLLAGSDRVRALGALDGEVLTVLDAARLVPDDVAELAAP